MTIAVGFVTDGGIVLAADSLYTVSGLKVLRPKLFPHDSPHCKVIFSCSGGAMFAESTIRLCITRIAAADPSEVNNTEGILAVIDEVLKEEWTRLVHDNPNRSYGADFQLLFAVWSEEDSLGGLYSTLETAIVKRERYECIGAGIILGHHLADSVFNPATGIPGTVVAATYVVGNAKTYVDGCGGPTDILVLRSDGVIEGVSWLYTEPLERLLRAFEANFGVLLIQLLTQPATHFSSNLEHFGQIMIKLRDKLGWADEGYVYKYQPEPLSEILKGWGIRQ